MTSKRELETELAHLRDRVTSLFKYSPDLIYVVDREGKLFEINSAAGPMLRYSPEQLQELSYADLFVPDERDGVMQRFARVMSGEVEQFEARLSDVDGVPHDFEVLAIPVVEHGEIVGAFGTARDISERARLQAELHHMAFTDHLTGMPNQRAMQQHLDELLAAGAPFALLLLDLDRFKAINDHLGHAAGDLLLRSVTLRLQVGMPAHARLFRYGGDELVIVLQADSEAQVLRFAEYVRQCFVEPFVLKDKDVTVSTSVGIATYPEDGSHVDTLFTKADNAMYFSKAHGRNTFTMYRAIEREGDEQRLQLELELRSALRAGELSVWFQPQVDLHTGELGGFEALMRWESPRLGLVDPADFIPIAEESGIIVELGAWVLEHACKQLAVWQRQGHGNVGLSVNVSIHQFYHPGYVESVQRTLAKYAVEPSQIMLELTESIASNADVVVAQLRALKQLGVLVAIDDFGTGYSSLQVLRRFPLDYIKIDRSFVAGIAEDEGDRKLVATIISLAHNLGLKTTAEGVETEAQLECLRECGADLAQGHYFAEALDATTASEWITARASLLGDATHA